MKIRTGVKCQRWKIYERATRHRRSHMTPPRAPIRQTHSKLVGWTRRCIFLHFVSFELFELFVTLFFASKMKRLQILKAANRSSRPPRALAARPNRVWKEAKWGKCTSWASSFPSLVQRPPSSRFASSFSQASSSSRFAPFRHLSHRPRQSQSPNTSINHLTTATKKINNNNNNNNNSNINILNNNTNRFWLTSHSRKPSFITRLNTVLRLLSYSPTEVQPERDNRMVRLELSAPGCRRVTPNQRMILSSCQTSTWHNHEWCNKWWHRLLLRHLQRDLASISSGRSKGLVAVDKRHVRVVFIRLLFQRLFYARSVLFWWLYYIFLDHSDELGVEGGREREEEESVQPRSSDWDDVVDDLYYYYYDEEQWDLATRFV